jgi:hypothetical protein
MKLAITIVALAVGLVLLTFGNDLGLLGLIPATFYLLK